MNASLKCRNIDPYDLFVSDTRSKIEQEDQLQDGSVGKKVN